MLLLGPVAILGRFADEQVERANVGLAARVAARAEGGVEDPARLALLGLLAPAVSGAVLGVVGAGAGALLLPRIVAALPETLRAALPLGWLALGAAAAAAAVAAIRTPRATLAAGVAVGAGLLVLLGLVALVPGAAG